MFFKVYSNIQIEKYTATDIEKLLATACVNTIMDLRRRVYDSRHLKQHPKLMSLSLSLLCNVRRTEEELQS